MAQDRLAPCFARDDADRKLLEAANVSAIYRWTEKWEFEGRETFSLMDSDALEERKAAIAVAQETAGAEPAPA